jgi:DUF971 family protein
MTDDSKAGAAGSPSGAAPRRDDDAVTPADLNVKLGEQRLAIQWRDGARSEYTLAALRAVCPCAQCRTERQRQGSNPLRILAFDPASVRVVSANLVGAYAIQFHWSDGHSTGIFDFRFLRAQSGR